MHAAVAEADRGGAELRGAIDAVPPQLRVQYPAACVDLCEVPLLLLSMVVAAAVAAAAARVVRDSVLATKVAAAVSMFSVRHGPQVQIPRLGETGAGVAMLPFFGGHAGNLAAEWRSGDKLRQARAMSHVALRYLLWCLRASSSTWHVLIPVLVAEHRARFAVRVARLSARGRRSLARRAARLEDWRGARGARYA